MQAPEIKVPLEQPVHTRPEATPLVGERVPVTAHAMPARFALLKVRAVAAGEVQKKNP